MGATDSLIGDNTDGAGLVRDIEHNLGFALRGKRVLVMSAGGAARGALLPLLAAQPAARRAADTQALQKQFGAYGKLRAGDYARYGDEQFDLVLNATSASLSNQVPPIAAGVLAPGSLAYDMVYGKSGSTCFLDFARGHGVGKYDPPTITAGPKVV
jgi:shikimate dehydrogenase